MERINNWKKKWLGGKAWERYTTFILFIIVTIAFNIRSNTSSLVSDFWNVLTGSSGLMIVVLGIAFVMMVGGIDLSVGYQISLVSVVIAILSMRQLPDWLVILGALAVGALCGLLNGVLVAFFDMVPFAATIATQIIFRGLSYSLSKGRMISNISETVRAVTKWKLFGIKGDIWLTILIVLLFIVVIHFSFLGTYMRAIGLDEESAGRAGIKVGVVKCFAYCIAGLLYATAAIILTSARGYAGSEIGIGMEITGIAAAYIGGILGQAEKPNVITLILGVLMIGMIAGVFPKVEIYSWVQYIVTGLLLIVTMGMHRKWKK